MSHKASNSVWDHSVHKGSALLVMVALADWANDSGISWHSINRLRKKVRMSERQVIRIIKKLEETGELKVQHRRNVGNIYQIALPGIDDKVSVINKSKESVIDSDANKSQLVTDSKSQLETDITVSHDPSLTVKEPPPKIERAIVSDDGDTNTITGEGSRVIADEDVDAENVVEWFSQRNEKNGVRSPAVEELPKVPRTEEDIKVGIKAAVIDNALRNEKAGKNPVVESYLATVPEHIRPLARVFCEHKKRPPLKKEDALWRREWQDQYDIGISVDDVTKAIKYMSKNNLGVRAPVSTLTIAENIRLGHIKPDDEKQIISEVSYDLPANSTVVMAEEADDSPMDEVMEDE